MSRRDSSDERWQEVKKEVRSRDKTDRLLKVVTAKEYLKLKKIAAPALLQRLDAAHVFSVSSHPQMCYDVDNIILLNRFSHENLDSCKDPITGERISPQERDDWWRRLIGSEQYDILIEKARRSKELAYGTAGSEDHP